MEFMQSNYDCDMAHHYLQTWYAQAPPRINDIKLEEEEQEGTSYVIPSNEDELGGWWNRFSQQYRYPLYCMILATEADTNVALLIDKCREELSITARDKCCFVYFRDLEKAKLLEAFRFSEHAKGIIRFIQLIEIQPNNLPCLLFFERIVEGKYVCVPIGNGTVSEIMGRIREVFTYIYSRSEVSLSSVKAFKFSKQVGVAGKTVGKSITQFAKDVVIDLLRSLAQVP